MNDRVRPQGSEAPAWSRTVTSTWMLATGVFLMLGFAAAALLVSDFRRPLVGLLLAGAAFLVTGAVRVSVTGRGVMATSAVAPFLRRTIPMPRIQHAYAKRARALELGGWGYRWRPRRTAVSLRTGDALWLDLVSGRQFVITVDDAESAARLVNAQLK